MGGSPPTAKIIHKNNVGMGKRVYRPVSKSTKKLWKKKAKKTASRLPVLVRDVNEQAAIGLDSPSLNRELIPKAFYTTMRYQEVISTLNPTVGGLAACLNYGANALYDPYLGVGGHQPMGWDYYMAFYKTAYVVSSRITARFTGSDSTYNNAVGIHMQEGAGAVIDAANAIENGNTVFDIVTNLNTNEGNYRCLSLEYKPKQFWGVPLDQSDTIHLNTASANPSKLCSFAVFCAPLQAVDATGCSVVITIDYKVCFRGPIEMAQN